jgi:polysaccharide chain length determinant protein (PEP-CTERM system associated)
MNAESGFQFSDLKAAFKRRRKAMGLCALIVALAGEWLALALPNQYESFATILVQPQIVSKKIAEAGIGETELSQRLGIMTSQILARPRLSRIIDEFDLYPDEADDYTRDEIIDFMRDAIRVEPVIPELELRAGIRRAEAEINTFRLYYSYENAGIAADVAQELAQNFIQEHIRERVELTQKSLDFMTAELNELAARIREVEAEVARVKAENPGKLPEELSGNQMRLQRIGGDLAFAHRELADAKGDEEFYRTAELGAGTTGDVTLSPGRRLKQLELARTQHIAAGHTEKHPDVIQIDAELAELRAQIDQLGKGPEEADAGAEIAASAETRRAVAKRILADEEVARLEAESAAIEALIAETPRIAEKLDGLQREYEHLFESYQDFSGRRLEATIQAQLERRQLGEQFKVIESAFEAPEPSSPNRWLILAITVVLALGAGVGLGVLLESTDTSVHDARKLQQSFSIPVLAAIPRIWLDSDRAAQRRARWRTAFGIVALIVFAQVGGAANYLWVNGNPLAGRRSESSAPAAEEKGAAAPAAADAEADTAEPEEGDE